MARLDRFSILLCVLPVESLRSYQRPHSAHFAVHHEEAQHPCVLRV